MIENDILNWHTNDLKGNSRQSNEIRAANVSAIFTMAFSGKAYPFPLFYWRSRENLDVKKNDSGTWVQVSFCKTLKATRDSDLEPFVSRSTRVQMSSAWQPSRVHPHEQIAFRVDCFLGCSARNHLGFRRMKYLIENKISAGDAVV